jgi:hypothetical protein
MNIYLHISINACSSVQYSVFKLLLYEKHVAIFSVLLFCSTKNRIGGKKRKTIDFGPIVVYQLSENFFASYIFMAFIRCHCQIHKLQILGIKKHRDFEPTDKSDFSIHSDFYVATKY